MSFPAKLKDEGTVKSGMVIYTDTTKIKKNFKNSLRNCWVSNHFFFNCFQGTVVIGKVESGSCSKGQTLAVYPNRQEVKVDQVIIT